MYIKVEDTFRVTFGTVNSSAAASAADSTPVVVVLEQGAPLAYSPTVTAIVTGLYEVTIDATAANGFDVGKEYSAYVTVVMGGLTSRDGLASFNVTARDIDDLATSASITAVQADTDDIQARLPAALVGGKMDSHVNDIAANAITAASIATDAIDADAIKADAVTEIQVGLATSSALATAQTAISAIKLSTDNLPSDPADESLIIAATTAISAAVSAIPTTTALAADLATAQAAITDISTRIPVALDGDGNMMSSVQSIVAGAIDAASVAAAAVTKIADGVFAYVIEAGAPAGARTFLQRLRIEWSVFASKALGLSIAAAGSETFRDAADTKDRATFTLALDGTRTPGTLDGD